MYVIALRGNVGAVLGHLLWSDPVAGNPLPPPGNLNKALVQGADLVTQGFTHRAQLRPGGGEYILEGPVCFVGRHNVHEAHDRASPAGADRMQCVVRQRVCAFRLWYYYGMKVALSIPTDLFDSAETLSKKLGLSRSRLYATALAEFLAKHRGRKTTDRLNAVYSSEASRLDPRLRRLQARSLGKSSW